ncbi:MAG: GNAT family N-acetyltransferase [Pseudonocardiaceae bacterium]
MTDSTNELAVVLTVLGWKPEVLARRLNNIAADDVTRSAEFVINISPEAQGKKFGTEATWLTLDYAFHLTNLRMVWLKVPEPDVGAIKAYEKAGFKPASRLRSAGHWLGEVCDELFMDALPVEFSGESVVLSKYKDSRTSTQNNRPSRVRIPQEIVKDPRAH